MPKLSEIAHFNGIFPPLSRPLPAPVNKEYLIIFAFLFSFSGKKRYICNVNSFQNHTNM